MIGLVLVTHGRLADEFKAALEHVMGPQKQIEAITIGAEDDSDLCRSDIIEAVNRVDSGDGVAILTDMFGGTPSNLAISCMSRPKVEVLAGINLLLFYVTGMSRVVDRLEAGDEAPPLAKFFAGASLFLWIAVMYFARLIPSGKFQP